MPSSRFRARQLGLAQRLGEFAPRAKSLPFRHQTGDGRAIPEKHKRDVLVMGSVDAVGEIACGICNADRSLWHTIRLSDFKDSLHQMVKAKKPLGTGAAKRLMVEGTKQVTCARRRDLACERIVPPPEERERASSRLPACCSEWRGHKARGWCPYLR